MSLRSPIAVAPCTHWDVILIVWFPKKCHKRPCVLSFLVSPTWQGYVGGAYLKHQEGWNATPNPPLLNTHTYSSCTWYLLPPKGLRTPSPESFAIAHLFFPMFLGLTQGGLRYRVVSADWTFLVIAKRRGYRSKLLVHEGTTLSCWLWYFKAKGLPHVFCFWFKGRWSTYLYGFLRLKKKEGKQNGLKLSLLTGPYGTPSISIARWNSPLIYSIAHKYNAAPFGKRRNRSSVAWHKSHRHGQRAALALTGQNNRILAQPAACDQIDQYYK